MGIILLFIFIYGRSVGTDTVLIVYLFIIERFFVEKSIPAARVIFVKKMEKNKGFREFKKNLDKV